MKIVALLLLLPLTLLGDPSPTPSDVDKAISQAQAVFDRLNAEEAQREQSRELREIMDKLDRDLKVRWNPTTREWEVVKR